MYQHARTICRIDAPKAERFNHGSTHGVLKYCSWQAGICHLEHGRHYHHDKAIALLHRHFFPPTSNPSAGASERSKPLAQPSPQPSAGGQYPCVAAALSDSAASW